MKFSLRLRRALLMGLILLVGMALAACTKPVEIDEEAELDAATEVFTQFIIAMNEGRYSRAFAHFAAAESDISADGLATMAMTNPTMFTGIDKVEILTFHVVDDPQSETRLRATLTGFIHYAEESRLFTAEMVKESETWLLLTVTFQD